MPQLPPRVPLPPGEQRKRDHIIMVIMLAAFCVFALAALLSSR